MRFETPGGVEIEGEGVTIPAWPGGRYVDTVELPPLDVGAGRVDEPQ